MEGLTLVALLLQAALGAPVRHSGAALACKSKETGLNRQFNRLRGRCERIQAPGCEQQAHVLMFGLLADCR